MVLHTDPVPTRNLLVTDWLSLLPAKIQNTWFWDMCWFTKTAAFSFCPIIQVNLRFSDKITFPKKSKKKTIVHKHTSTLAWSSKIQIQHPPPPIKSKQNKQRIHQNRLLTLQILWFYAFKFIISLLYFIHSLHMHICFNF